jgi:hypothetical protein
MSFSSEVTGTMPHIGMFGFWESRALRYTTGSPNFGSYLAHR